MVLSYIPPLSPAVYLCTVIDDFGSEADLPTCVETVDQTNDPIGMALLFFFSGEVH